VSDQLEPELERVARMLTEAGPLPDAPATLRERALAIPDGGPMAGANDIAAAAQKRRRWQRPRPLALAGIAAVVAAIVIVPTVIVTSGDDGGNHRIALSPRAFAPKGGGDASIVKHGDGSATISLRVWKMPQQDASKAYEAWLGREGDRRALGTFATDAAGAATVSFTVPRSELSQYEWLWVTSEPKGGSAKPSEDTALWAPLT
jgi:anti-sigma-K factor RskA